MATFAKEVQCSSGEFVLNTASVGGNYSPAETDTIVLCPIGPDSADEDASSDVVDGNVKAYVEWSTSPDIWTIKVSDSSFAGKVLVLVKT